ncbi:SGNH/GDSL hydrolase family protein [Xylophilus sp. GOD-11R]|uniref:SGNH/GDSL hydrolase family protein n=1 Tax=Xylophilus sp. GOD-11R TaxID=3089814 RepID=UPI00298CED8A|nr:SGNH/GDSL hydrolase family protein [Xylophilus sp. GOD-11R]WPB56933.1 SGNH/GDSL hydrolase family protein [Xylophilus sp. GOD-11R]
MTVSWLRRTAVLTIACASAALLTACGSGTVDSAIRPSRFVVFGDGLSDVGQTGTRYTVNDGSVNIWAQQLASRYGVGLTAVSAGGSGYAVGNARVTLHPDAAGVASTPTVTEQIDTFLASDSPKSSDLILVGGGISDVLANFAAYRAGTMTSDQAVAASRTAGTELGAQVRRMVNAGARYVMSTGVYDIGRSPFGTASGQASVLTSQVTAFNTALELAIANLGDNVLFVDAQYYYNLQIGVPGSYNFDDGTTVVCTSVDAGNGIGTGTGQLNSALCNTGTIKSGVDYSKFEFADNVYFTPVANRQFGNYAYDRLRLRF